MITLPRNLSATYWAKRKQREAVGEAMLLQQMTADELWVAVEAHITERSTVYAHDWSPDYRREHAAELRRLRRELNRRGLPSRKPDWMADAEAEATDIRDLADTRECVL